MGSFNVKCGISNFPILENHEAVCIPILKNNFSRNRDILVNSNDFFKFSCLGIKGKYNGYNELEDIERDSNYDFLLNILFGKRIDISDDKLFDFLKNKGFKFFYINGIIYDKIISGYFDDLLDFNKNKNLEGIYNSFITNYDKCKDRLYSINNEMFYIENNIECSGVYHYFSIFNFNYISLEKEMSFDLNQYLFSIDKECFLSFLENIIRLSCILEVFSVIILPTTYVEQGEMYNFYKGYDRLNNILKEINRSSYND